LHTSGGVSAPPSPKHSRAKRPAKKRQTNPAEAGATKASHMGKAPAILPFIRNLVVAQESGGDKHIANAASNESLVEGSDKWFQREEEKLRSGYRDLGIGLTLRLEISAVRITLHNRESASIAYFVSMPAMQTCPLMFCHDSPSGEPQARRRIQDGNGQEGSSLFSLRNIQEDSSGRDPKSQTPSNQRDRDKNQRARRGAGCQQHFRVCAQKREKGSPIDVDALYIPCHGFSASCTPILCTPPAPNKKLRLRTLKGSNRCLTLVPHAFAESPSRVTSW
jgi:hypothetical protein